MPTRQDPDTDVLLAQASQGNRDARDQLLERHRPRLRQLIGLRLDRRLAARLDPSDVVQESLADAAGKLDDYLRTRPLPFYPWLRGIALGRLIDMYRWHIRTGKRSVRREQRALPPLPDESVAELVHRLCARGSSPSEKLARSEAGARVRAALDQLSERDRELLVLRHLEQLSIREIAGVLGISEGAVKVRHVRALERLRDWLGEDPREPRP
jgi:RNA polymerase sigma-70 factor (ECF subfamily)